MQYHPIIWKCSESNPRILHTRYMFLLLNNSSALSLWLSTQLWSSNLHATLCNLIYDLFFTSILPSYHPSLRKKTAKILIGDPQTPTQLLVGITQTILPWPQDQLTSQRQSEQQSEQTVWKHWASHGQVVKNRCKEITFQSSWPEEWTTRSLIW